MTGQNKRADELARFDKVFDAGSVTEVTFGQTNGDVRLTVLANGNTWQTAPETLCRLASDEEIAELEQAAHREAVANSLVGLAGLIRSAKLPIGRLPEFSMGVLGPREELAQWAHELGVEIEFSANIPAIREGRFGALDVRGQSRIEPKAVEPADEAIVPSAPANAATVDLMAALKASLRDSAPSGRCGESVPQANYDDVAPNAGSAS